jgi:multiple sugar transport system substrate-binding protein
MKKAICTVIVCLLALVAIQVAFAQKTKITYWTFIDPTKAGPRNSAFKQQLEAFAAKYPDIEATIEIVGWDKIDADLIQAVQSGKGPDVVRVYPEAYQLQIEAGTLMPLDKYTRGMDQADWLVDWNQTVFNGHKMFLPIETRAASLWYRQDFLDKAGMKVPRTFEELATAGAAVTKATGVMGYAVGGSSKDGGAGIRHQTIAAVWSQGAPLIKADKRAAFEDKAFVRWFNYMRSLEKLGVMGTEVLSMGADDVLAAFQAGKVCFTIEGGHRLNQARSGAGVGMNLKMGPPITFAGLKPVLLVGAWSFAITKTSKNPDAAWKFIDFMLSPEMQMVNARVAGELPSRVSVLKDPWFGTTDTGKEQLQWVEWIRAYGRLETVHPELSKWSMANTNAFHELLLTTKPAEDILSSWTKWYNTEVGF